MQSDNSRSLYRLEAVNARQSKWLGEIVLVRPLSFSFLTAFAFTFASLVVAFSIWGTYTKRSTVSGQLIPASGLIKVYVPQPGIVLEKHVFEGRPVKQGQVLYVLSSERRSSTRGETQAAISKQAELRKRSLDDERNKTLLLQQKESDMLVRQISGLQAELQNLDGQIKSQRYRARLSAEAEARYRNLATQGAISRDALQQKQADMLDQATRLKNLERDRITVARELDGQQNDLNGLPLKQANLLAQIDRSITSAEQDLTESEAKRRLVITAPETGTATTAIADVGQAVDMNRPLVSIVPIGAKLQAHLYVPSKAVGFIKTGDPVLLRYQAYPYQKFGHYQGTVATVSKTALPTNELTGAGNLVSLANGATSASNAGANAGAFEPMYRVTVDLAAQTIVTYGKPQSLQAGMLLDADVLQDTRRLYEWVLEPLYSLTGKL
jgi:membrane fusion protein